MYDVCCLKYGVVGNGGEGGSGEKNKPMLALEMPVLQQKDRLIWEPGLSEPRRHRTQPPAPATHTVFSAQSQLRGGPNDLTPNRPLNTSFRKLH